MSSSPALPGPDAEGLLERFRAELAAADDPAAVEAVRVRHLGKKSEVKAALRSLGAVAAEQRAEAARRLNDVQAAMERALDEVRERVEARALAAGLEEEWMDLSLPGVAPRRGAVNPLTAVERACMAILRRFGFERAEGPEVDTAFYNFDALNIPENHPARELQDTFWLSGGLLLRSHTTTVQARVLHARPPLPIRVASPGRAYRNEATDATHLAMFHQFEGLWVDRGLTFGHLKGLLMEVAKAIYGPGQRFRFKPKYYPYTEPSLGMDLRCVHCEGQGCASCHGAGWVTILGAGMVHPAVLERFGYDAAEVGGFAFGLGFSRIAAQASGVSSMKSLYEPDLRIFSTIQRGAAA